MEDSGHKTTGLEVQQITRRARLMKDRGEHLDQMMNVKEFTTFTLCGHECSFCPSFQGDSEHPCKGCNQHGGRPWWGECKVYRCAEERSVNHCGLCGDFPCDLLAGHYNPDNPDGQKNAAIRMGVLAYRQRHGDEAALALLRKTRE
ncbi:DUF3795 domain-containing protein [Candidatus Thorarchaeota archaeon]|nr:MAG: DUF3795 domain-containing protein [Candidatus Thorarchaeota archaeon]